jgi:hypothetical protein
MHNAWYAFFCYAAVVAVIVRAITKEEIFREPRGGRPVHGLGTGFAF